MSPVCPACGAASATTLAEAHHDRHSGTDYTLHACGCGVVFAWPCEPACAAWYAAAVPLEASRPPGDDPRYRLFFSDLAPEPGLLDLGCGDGGFLALARERGFSPCTGLDHDERRAALAREKGLDARTGDWAAFLRGLPEGSLKTATLFDVLEHLHDPRGLLKELRRALGPGGRLALTVPNASRPLPFGREDFDLPPHHLTRWTPAALRAFLEREGFSVTRLDASRQDWSLTRELMALHWGVKPIAALKRLLLGAAPKAMTDAAPSQGSARRGLFDLYKTFCECLAAAPAALLCAWWSLTRPDSGPSLYISARRR
ncbi:MAG: hypothetical protein A2V88_08120 [Elusimicrobia bacterium RBG_16_66_12]|nr:MAG: hypothetical protein A2V88_08120 [Elusimicrobia bacterium RBG_16_66_12]